MTELEDQLRATLHARERDIDASTVRSDYSHLSAEPSAKRLLPFSVAVAVVAVIGLVAYLAWPSSGTAVNQPAGGDDTVLKGGPPPWIWNGVAATPTVTTRGVSVGIKLVFDEDRVITRGQLVMTDGTTDRAVEFYVEDGKDSEGGNVVPLEVAAGVIVDVDATVLPACGVEVTAAPAFSIESGSGPGGESLDGAAAAELPAWQQAVQDWCASGVHAHLSGYLTTLDGGVTQTVTIYNPGPDPVTVVCVARAEGESGWDAGEVTVEGATATELRVHGVNVDPDAGPPLTANGTPLEVING